MVRQVTLGEPGEAGKLPGMDRLFRGSAGCVAPGAHFNEDHRRSVEGDQVQLTQATAGVSLDETVSGALQVGSRERLAPSPQTVTVIARGVYPG